MGEVKVSKGIPCYLGEGPHWNEKKGELLYVDLLGNAVLRYVPSTGESYKVVLGSEPVSLVVPVAGTDDEYLVAINRSLAIMRWDGMSGTASEVRVIHTVDDHSPTNRFNDGKCDAKGRLWAGTMGSELGPGQFDLKKGSLYSVSGQGAPRSHFNSVDISNGLTWSKDNTKFFYIDSLAYKVESFDFVLESGEISNRKTVYDFKENGEVGLPDGMAVDDKGFLWVAVFDGGKVIRIDPGTGKKVGQVELPTQKITSVCFGGDVMYVTSARHFLTPAQLEEQKEAGCVFEVKGLGVTGQSGVDFVL